MCILHPQLVFTNPRRRSLVALLSSLFTPITKSLLSLHLNLPDRRYADRPSFIGKRHKGTLPGRSYHSTLHTSYTAHRKPGLSLDRVSIYRIDQATFRAFPCFLFVLGPSLSIPVTPLFYTLAHLPSHIAASILVSHAPAVAHLVLTR